MHSERATVLQRTRNLKMARSAHAYDTLKFYELLDDTESSKIPRGTRGMDLRRLPCGQPRPLGDSDGEDRDLDQSVIGNPPHDLIRSACRSQPPHAASTRLG
jgi:hypothetical protein